MIVLIPCFGSQKEKKEKDLLTIAFQRGKKVKTF